MAITITLLFVSAVYVTFVQISKGHQAADARMDALRNGRAALATMTDEIKAANRLGSDFLFSGIHMVLSYGDGFDNNGDGQIDEEVVNGALDAPTTATAAQLGLHAQLGTHQERPLAVGRATLGDSQVDVDAKFGRDVLTFKVFPKVPTPAVGFKVITYGVMDYEGQSNVLVRQVQTYPQGSSTATSVSIAPLAFRVAGFDLLFWDPNALPADQGWVTSWDSTQWTQFANPKFPLPGSVYIRLTMIADPRPLESLVSGQPMDVIPLETIVNIEAIINDAQYPRPSL